MTLVPSPEHEFFDADSHLQPALLRAPGRAWINAQCAREALSPAGLGAIIWAAVDTGEITAEEAPLLVRSMLSAGLDTTIVGIGNALYAFATNPAQWEALREKPALARPAFDEVLRWESPIQTFFRTTTRTVDIGGVEIPQDAKVLLFLASANRDPRRWDRTRALRRQPPGHRSRCLRRRHSFVRQPDAGAPRGRDDHDGARRAG
jgi:hypothetical protein